MAKNKNTESVEQPVVEQSVVVEQPVVEQSRFRVYCHASTPLAVNPFEALAESEDDAKKLFFAANGISGTDSKIDIGRT
jgi:hypothetical protein